MRFYLPALLGTILAVSLTAVPALADVSGLVRGVVTVEGRPAANVAVTLSGENSTLRTRSAAQGEFAFPRVPFGRYALSAHREGFSDAQERIEVGSDSVVTVTLAVGKLREIGRTAGTLRGVSGTPVSENVIGRAQIAALPANNSLNSVIRTVPGIVRFSYNEPVAHGFHGVAYEIDGAPLPQSTSSNFAEIVDPKDIDSLEVFTGAFPAEFGGSRQGAVINIVSKRTNDIAGHAEGAFTLGAGNYGSSQTGLAQSLRSGQTRLFINANEQRTGRGLDSPTFDPIHDNGNQSDQFVRLIAPLGARDTIALDLSNQLATFQIPINTTLGPNNPVVSSPGTDDVQREYDRFFNLVYTRTSKDGNGFFQAIPWARSSRVAFDGDLPKDLLGTFTDPSSGAVTPLNGLRQDRRASYTGLRLANFRASAHHAFKIGAEGSVENFRSAVQISQQGSPDFFDNVTQRGSLFGAYVQDKWTPSRTLSINAGLRYDRSTGFVGGNQLSPRFEINLAPDAKNILHFYYGRMYAAPALEDVRRDAVVLSGGGAVPVYDLKPQRDSYYEFGLAHTFAPGLSGYVNYFSRNAANVLDTTQLFPTPIFAVFNNAIGRAEGVEMRLQQSLRSGDSWFFSGTVSSAVAGGISGSTFLFPPDAISNTSLQPEDHDQTVTINSAYTKRFGAAGANFATLQTEYGTGYPTQFESGPGRLPSHLTFNFALGRDAGRAGKKSLGYAFTAENFTNRKYLLKVNNGFNTTQWGPGATFLFKVTAPL